MSDAGTQFTSELMREVLKICSVNQTVSTPYHHQTVGVNERWNGTLEKMMARVCQEYPKGWDRYLPAILFSYREILHDSTGFSPYFLLFGREMHGPMSILREMIAGKVECQAVSVYQYLVELRQRLQSSCEIAADRTVARSKVNKKHYDRLAAERTLSPDDMVLLLLPTAANKMFVSLEGPC